VIAFVYPGQGSQRVGMAADVLADEPGVFDRYFTRAEVASGLPIRTHCLEGPADVLTRTDVAQPAIFALSLALDELARLRGLIPNAVSGHSLGEYTAAVAAGSLGLDDGFRLVALRGRLMAEAQADRPGGMAAVMGLETEKVARLCAIAGEHGPIEVANINAPAQTVVSGADAAVQALMKLAEEAHAARTVRLRVGAAFHSSLMRDVGLRMQEAIDSVSFADPRVPIVANVAGHTVTRAADVRRELVEQIRKPVRWVACVRTLVDMGCTTFIELGPGRVLSDLIRQIDARVTVTSVDSPKAIADTVRSHG
jgi:[acyl-carrier-protein] S-malonyltransferase